jgi:predicted RNA-binding Zn-ribbon protein involved in translation (DUF1610 family)
MSAIAEIERESPAQSPAAHLPTAGAPSALDLPRQMDHCPNQQCEQVVPLTHVQVKDGFARMLCPSCGRVYRCAIVYRGGVAVPAGEIQLVSDQRTINAMKAIAALRTEG